MTATVLTVRGTKKWDEFKVASIYTKDQLVVT